MGTYKLYYSRTGDLMTGLLFGLLWLGIIMVTLSQPEPPQFVILIGFVVMPIFAFIFLDKYRKNEYIESVAVEGKRATLSYSNGKKQSYSFDEIKNIVNWSFRGVKYVDIGLKKRRGIRMRPYDAEAEKLYYEFSSHPGWGEQPLF